MTREVIIHVKRARRFLQPIVTQQHEQESYPHIQYQEDQYEGLQFDISQSQIGQSQTWQSQACGNQLLEVGMVWRRTLLITSQR
jgi:hypothetical protein